MQFVPYTHVSCWWDTAHTWLLWTSLQRHSRCSWGSCCGNTLPIGITLCWTCDRPCHCGIPLCPTVLNELLLPCSADSLLADSTGTDKQERCHLLNHGISWEYFTVIIQYISKTIASVPVFALLLICTVFSLKDPVLYISLVLIVQSSFIKSTFKTFNQQELIKSAQNLL